MTLKYVLIASLLLTVNICAGQTTPYTLLINTDNPALQDSTALQNIEVEASFPGDAPAWRNYLMANLKPNVPVKRKAPAGTYKVIVQFIVAKDGSISDITALSSHGYGMEEEVMRIIKKGPNWIPAQQNGKFVNAYRKQPVTFVVSEK